MTRCIDEGQLRAFLDGALSETERTDVEEHAPGCESCSARLEELRLLSSRVSSLMLGYSPIPDPQAALATARAELKSDWLEVGVEQPRIRDFKIRLVPIPQKPRIPAPRIVDRFLPAWTRLAMVGVSLSVIMVAVLLALMFTGNESPEVSNPQGLYIPSGKVRHMVITYGGTFVNRQVPTGTEEIWLADGPTHRLMRKVVTVPPFLDARLSVTNSPSVYSQTTELLVGQDAVWVTDAQGRVFRTPYDERHFESYLPDPQFVSDLLKSRFTLLDSNATIDGRPVTVLYSGHWSNYPRLEVENTGKTPVVFFLGPLRTMRYGLMYGYYDAGIYVYTEPDRIISSSAPGAEPVITVEYGPSYGYSTSQGLWVDRNTHEIVQSEFNYRWTGGRVDGGTSTSKVTTDELLDAGQLPPDFFTFKPPAGATVTDAYAAFVDSRSLYSPNPTTQREVARKFEPHTPQIPTATAQAIAESAKVGGLAPDFTLLDVKTNRPVNLSSLRGKPLLINFWGTWCPPCREEMPIIQTLYEKYAGQVEIVGVSMGPRDYPEQVISYINQYGYTWTFLHDPDMSVMESYAVQGIPASYFIDKDGVIRSITVGGAPATLLESELLKAITQAPVPVETTIVVEEPPAFTPTPAPVSQVDPPRMPLEEFKLLYDDPATRPLILDVRAREAYDEGHIAGAISFPEADVDIRVSELAKDRLIVAYCQ